MDGFTPVPAAAGGALIGLSAALLWIGLGRIAGISGILGGLLRPRGGDVAWRVAFLGGLMGAPALYGLFGGVVPAGTFQAGPGILVAAGLLVGFGTRLANGCTSGHGVCGLARLSPRSMAATGLFIATAVLTVFLVRHVIGG